MYAVLIQKRAAHSAEIINYWKSAAAEKEAANEKQDGKGQTVK